MSLQLTTDPKLKNYLTNVVSQLKGSLSGSDVMTLVVNEWEINKALQLHSVNHVDITPASVI